MSIKSLFEDIADAIREKSGSSDAYTPAEMPSAIRSIPSGSSTASGVSYDNTASGLTANNVQDAIDELAEDVTTITSDLSELKYKVLETAPANTTYSNQLSVLNAKWVTLSDAEKLRCSIVRGSVIYRQTVTRGNFNRYAVDTSDVTIDELSIYTGSIWAKSCVVRSSGATFDNYSAQTDTLPLSLVMNI